MQNTKRLEFIDGLKGILCLLIFAGHFCIAFYFFTEKLHKTILSNFVCGIIQAFWILPIFAILSGYLIYKNASTLKDVIFLILKRFLRFQLPIVFVLLFCWIAYKSGLFFSFQAGKLLNNNWLEGYYPPPEIVNLKFKHILYMPFWRFS